MFDREAKEVDQIRSNIIQSFLSLEHLLNGAIAGEYFIDSTEELLFRFWSEVLDQELFSFELKKRILYAVLKSNYPALYKDFPRRELDRLQTIRNIIAHGLEVHNETSGLKASKSTLYRSKGRYEPQVLYAEYWEHHDLVEGKIMGLPNTYMI